MLYERWREIARARREEIALRDLAQGRAWTFRELAEQTEAAAPSTHDLAHPQGGSAAFVFAVLRAWREGRVVCPLEVGQAPPGVPIPPPGIVHLKTTSATTGVPRVVALTAAQLAADADNIVETMGLRPDWPNLGVISLAHSYGFSNLVAPLLLHGIPLFLLDSPLPEAVRRAAASAPRLTLPAVPALWRAWHEAGAIPPNIGLAISAGAPLPLPLEQAVFAATGLKLHNFYGATECGGIAYDATNTPRDDASCVGGPMKNVALSANGDGWLEVRGPAVAEIYWHEPGADLANGCYRTSDLVELNDGRVFLRGRASEQINIAGRKVSPETIERALLAHSLVRDCLVFGVPSADAERGESIVVCIVARAAVTSETLRQFLLPKLPAWQLPREWRFVGALDANERGKLSRAEWRRKFLHEAGTEIPSSKFKAQGKEQIPGAKL